MDKKQVIFIICILLLLLLLYIYYHPKRLKSDHRVDRLFQCLPESDYQALLNYLQNLEFLYMKQDIFQDYDCYIFKNGPDMIKSGTMLYFLDNDISWNDQVYYYCEATNHMYFPQPNSMIVSQDPLRLIKKNKKKDLKLIIGKLKT
jgi:hypothetical protein